MQMTLVSGVHLPVDRLAEVCQRYEVKELAIFGSAARGDMRPDSDIDILVEFQTNARIGLLKFESLSEELEVLLGRRVDLVTKRGLKPQVRPYVLREAQLVYSA
jgi:predicted nucleotidyltransferase